MNKNPGPLSSSWYCPPPCGRKHGRYVITCQKCGYSRKGSESRIRDLARKIVSFRRAAVTNEDLYFMDKYIFELEKILQEGEGSEDRLYRTAVYLLEYFQRHGEKEFRGRFGSLDILDPARKIVAEGEGNPHPWE